MSRKSAVAAPKTQRVRASPLLARMEKTRARYKRLQYVAGPSAHYSNEVAEVLGHTLEELATTGDVTPHRLLEVCRADDAPLHGLFEWRDDVAAEAYRLHQARQAINTLELVLLDDKKGQHRVKAMFSLRTHAEVDEVERAPRRYVTADEAITDSGHRTLVLQDATTALRAWYRRYAPFDFPELKEVMQVIRIGAL